MALDPILQAIVDTSKAQGRTSSLAAGTVDEARQAYLMTRAIGGEDAPVAAVADADADGVPVRVYVPDVPGPLPICVYFHGGGFTIGSVESHDPLARRLAAESGAVVVSVDYRLAPEHTFPAAVDDAWTALRWAARSARTLGGETGRPMAVAGDSAGGNLAAVSAILARDAGGPPLCFQLLIYPTVDARGGYPSLEENAEGPFLTKETMDWFYEQYRPDPEDWRASPILAPDLSRLPPALILTAQYDPLRDEGEAYGEALRAAGVEVVVHRYETMPHVFAQMYGILPTAQECMTRMAAALRSAFAARVAPA